LLLITLVIGTGAGTAAGTKSWLAIGGHRIGQPAELGKLAVILMLARWLAERREPPTTLRELIFDIGGGVPGGRQLKAVIPGGSSVPVFTPDEIDTPADFDSIQAAGSFLGSAAIIVVDDRCCMVQLALRAAQFYMHESCGKCTPCRVGTRWLVQLLTRIEEGHGEATDLDLLDDVCDRMLGKSLCALGDFAVYPVSSYLRKYRAEFEAHVERRGCPFDGESSIEGIIAPVEQHAAHIESTLVPA